MKRSHWITGAIVLQALWALALVGLVVFLLVLARKASPEVSAGLKTGSAVLGVPALFAIASWYGRCSDSKSKKPVAEQPRAMSRVDLLHSPFSRDTICQIQ